MKTSKRSGTLSCETSMKRRQFLGCVAATASLASIISSCKKDSNNNAGGGIDLGSGDVGILNYAYTLEQLEAAFYAQVIETQYTGMSPEEVELLTDIRDHEVAHREFFKQVLSTAAIPSLKMNFSTVDFSNKDSVLATAKTFEDLGVSAYNGAGQLLTSTDYLLIAGKIVSVEARHAAYIRDLLSPGSFADDTIVDANGLDVMKSPADVLSSASPFLITKLDASHLPTN
jgi:ferritin-like protein